MKISVTANEMEQLVTKYIEDKMGVKVKDIRWNGDLEPVYPISLDVKTNG